MTDATKELPAPQTGHAGMVGEEIDHSICEAFDLADDTLMLAELQGKVINSYMYSVTGADGKKVEGLNKVGVDWACREFAKRHEIIRMVGDPNFFRDPLDPEFVIVVVRAQRFHLDRESGKEAALDNALGCKRQWSKVRVGVKKVDQNGRWIRGEDGNWLIDHYEERPDSFYIEKALSKAQRNAKASLLPKAFIIEVLKQIKGEATTTEAAKTSRKAETKPVASTAKPAETKPTPAETKPASAETKPPAQPTAGQKGFDMNTLRNNAIAAIRKVAPPNVQIPVLWEHLTGTKGTADVPKEMLIDIASIGGRKGIRCQVIFGRWILRTDTEVVYPKKELLTAAQADAVAKEFTLAAKPAAPAPPPPAGGDDF